MKVVLEFDSDLAADNFTSWWLDGGGEQYLGFYSKNWDLEKGYIRVEGEGSIDHYESL